jgi:competence protein ComEC
LVWLVPPLLTGYALSASWPDTPARALTLLALPLAAAAVALGWNMAATDFRRSRAFALWAGCFFLAATLVAWVWHDLRVQLPPAAWATLPPRDLTLTLRITQTFAPTQEETSASGIAKVVDAPPGWPELLDYSVCYRVKIPSGENPPVRGATVEIAGRLTFLPPAAPDAATSPKDVSAAGFNLYLQNQGAWFELTRGRLLREVSPPSRWEQWLTTQSAHLESLLRHGPTGLEATAGNAYVAMVLGKTALLDETQREIFTLAGVRYLFAISGLHVAILAGVLWWGLRRIPGLPRFAGDIITLAVLWLYVEITGGSPSAHRAALMLTFFLAAIYLGRARGSLAAILAAGVFVLVLDPLALNNAGFQLSYSVVLGLILYASPLLDFARNHLTPWRDLPAASHAPWQRCALWIWGRLLACLVVSWTALVCSVPLVAEYFGVFSAGNFFFNPVIIPFVLVTLWAGAWAIGAGLLVIPPFGWLAWCANAVGLFFIAAMQKLAALALPIPGLHAQLRWTPGWSAQATVLAILATMLLTQSRTRPRAWHFLVPPAVLAAGALFAVHAI